MKKSVIVLALILLCGVFFSCAKHEHQFGEWKTIKEPKCAETGSEERVCECGEKQSRSIPAKGHKEEVVAAVEATCTETGLTEGTRCTVCGEIVKVQEEVPAKGHVEKLVTDTEPTCTEKGAGHNECEVCGERLDDVEIPAKGHTEGEWITDKEAGCTEKGSKHKECTVCGEKLTVEKIPAKGHTEGEWVTDKEATCTEKGSKHLACAVCKQSLKTDTISAKGHSESSWITDRAATCSAEGSRHKECKRCGVTLKTETLAKTAHKWKAATCQAPKTCSVCGATEGSKLDHQYQDHKCVYCGRPDIEIKVLNTFPQEFKIEGFGRIYSKMIVSNLIFEIDSSGYLDFIIDGEITYIYAGFSGGFQYTIKDSDGYTLITDSCYLIYFKPGDKFRGVKEYTGVTLEKGKSYTLELSDS